MIYPAVPIEAFEVRLNDLSLRTTFRTHRKTLRHHSTVVVRVRAGGTWGEGEAYTMDPSGVAEVLRALRLEGSDPFGVCAITERIEIQAARSAVDLALHDWIGRSLGLPVYRYLGLPSVPRTSCVSVGVDEPERMIHAAERWIKEGYPILKVKITTDTDPAVLTEIRRLGGESLEIWVDANQAFEPEQAVRVSRRLSAVGVSILEQPLSVGRIDDYAALRPHLAIPVILDEEIQSAADVARAARAGGIDGINIKLAKLGGVQESLRAIRVARAHGLSVLIGCFFESSLGIAASTHLQSLADRVDLDAPLFLENDPYTGLEFDGAVVAPPERVGIGVTRQVSRNRGS